MSAAAAPGSFWLELRSIVRLALPVIGTQVAFMGIGVADVVMSGRLSALDLAAVSVGVSFQMPIYLISMGILMLVNPIVAHLHGAGDHGRIGGKLLQSLWLSLFLAVPAVVLLFQAKPVLLAMDIEPRVAHLAAGYLRALALGFPFAFLFMSLRFFNEALSYVKPTALVIGAALPLNILGNYALMYGHFGLPRLGAIGTGYSSSLVMFFMFVSLGCWSASVLGKSYGFLRFEWPRWADLREQLALGVPNGVSLGMEVTMFALVAMFIASLGPTQVGAHQIAMNVSSVTFMVPLGIALSLGIRIGQAAGAGNYVGVWTTVRVGLVLTVVLQILMALAMAFWAETIVSWYTRDPELIRLAALLLLYAAVFQLSDGLQVVGSGALRGIKDTKIPMLANILAYWGIGLPLGLWLGKVRGLGPTGFWTGLVAGLTFAALLHNFRLFWLLRRRLALGNKGESQPY